jgi:chaperonin cofactor prefoldin
MDEMRISNLVLDVRSEALDKSTDQVTEELDRLKHQLKELSMDDSLEASQ